MRPPVTRRRAVVTPEQFVEQRDMMYGAQEDPCSREPLHGRMLQASVPAAAGRRPARSVSHHVSLRPRSDQQKPPRCLQESDGHRPGQATASERHRHHRTKPCPPCLPAWLLLPVAFFCCSRRYKAPRNPPRLSRVAQVSARRLNIAERSSYSLRSALPCRRV